MPGHLYQFDNYMKEILIYDLLSLILVSFIFPYFCQVKSKKTKNFERKISLLNLNINPKDWDSTKWALWIQKQILNKLIKKKLKQKKTSPLSSVNTFLVKWLLTFFFLRIVCVCDLKIFLACLSKTWWFLYSTLFFYINIGFVVLGGLLLLVISLTTFKIKVFLVKRCKIKIQ